MLYEQIKAVGMLYHANIDFHFVGLFRDLNYAIPTQYGKKHNSLK